MWCSFSLKDTSVIRTDFELGGGILIRGEAWCIHINKDWAKSWLSDNHLTCFGTFCLAHFTKEDWTQKKVYISRSTVSQCFATFFWFRSGLSLCSRKHGLREGIATEPVWAPSDLPGNQCQGSGCQTDASSAAHGSPGWNIMGIEPRCKLVIFALV